MTDPALCVCRELRQLGDAAHSILHKLIPVAGELDSANEILLGLCLTLRVLVRDAEDDHEHEAEMPARIQ